MTFQYFIRRLTKKYLTWLPDAMYLRLLYFGETGKKLHLKHPRTFNEKIQWLKLHDRNDRHTEMVDKYAVKEFVSKIIGTDYIFPSIGVWDAFDDIDFSSLPNQFVLKTTHGGGSGGVVICKDKSTFDIENARRKIENSLKSDIYTSYREWPYKNVRKRIIAEKYFEDENGELRDYKFFCMNGEPKFMFMASGRMKEDALTFDFLDMDYKWIPVRNGHPNSKTLPQKPQNFDTMVALARKLSQGEVFVRVDLYNIRGKIYFGEYTFFHNSGCVLFEPDEWDKRFGEMIKLPTSNICKSGN